MFLNIILKYRELMNESTDNTGAEQGIAGSGLSDQDVDSLIASNEPFTNIGGQEPLEILKGEQNNASNFEKTIKWNGQEIKVDSEEKLMKWAQQGYDYGQKMHDFNKRNQEFDERYKTYENIDKYASENPDWWQHVQSQYQNKGASQSTQSSTDQDTEINPVFNELKSELADLRNFKNDILAERESVKRKQQDEVLDADIKAIKETHNYLDWSDFDENGKNLETKVLEHANNNGINSFKAAFLDLNYDKLMERTKIQAKEEATGELKKQKQLGLLGEVPTTVAKILNPPENIKNQSYDSILKETMEELGIE